ncbi:GntR family transcriptional regulator [Phaeobacter sp. 22II1-1F12B]|uniref:GntR family transcriptional regulator n=1 Tax=Phaeobacter sp. 22II1-1F12B TaxID=1317111 RepID=UPI000B528FE3|nr:GntR family transcriptional regulator [Phaeobacter sp. 22II1-1F12B]
MVNDVVTPLYHQITLILRQRIEAGFYGAGGRIPSELELASEFNVSRITVSRAINDLAQAGLVERRRGAGTRVIGSALNRPVVAGIGGLLQSLNDMGSRTQVKVLEYGFVSPAPDVQAALDIPADTQVQRAVRVRSFKDEPFSYLTSFLPEEIGAQFDEKAMGRHSMMELLRMAGVRVGSAEQSFSAALADPQTSAALDVVVGTPLLAINRVVRDDADRPVEYLRILYRTDRYQYRMTMDGEAEGAAQSWSTTEH